MTIAHGDLRAPQRPPFGNVRPAGRANAALVALSPWALAVELAPARINSVSPDPIATPTWSRMAEDKREAMFAGAAAKLPARRIGQAEDIANAVLFLATTPFTTGSTVRVDDGGAIA